MKFNLTCAACKSDLPELKNVNALDNENLSVGDIFVCGGCGAINEITLSEPKIFTDFDRLSAVERADIDFITRMLSRQHGLN